MNSKTGSSGGLSSRLPASRQPLRGMALIVTLAMVVLLAFLLVALFSRATSTLAIEKTSSGGVEALLLARSATGLIVSDLQAEMKASSTQIGTAWLPGTNTAMLPSRQVLVDTNDANFLNLIKQSGVPMCTNGSPTIAISGGMNTATPAGDGRKITAARWSTPMLTGSAFTTNTPNWIYINRNTTLSASPSTDAIGRFAYNVYDLGGLLDMNAAGFSPKSSGANPDEMSTKGGVVWADLRSIPGIDSNAYANNASWPPQWRIRGNWETFTSTDTNSSLSWYHKVGWLQPYLNDNGASSDRMFSSRQDLIRYAKANINTFSTNSEGLFPALQYLTVFSRDANQPSHEPPATRPKIQFDESQGGNDARGEDDKINPGARDTTGKALVKKRFALGNIALLSAASLDASRIKTLFGLTKSGTTWVYDHGDPGRILDLEDVPADRAPDFFEMLKAAIHAGSLGVQHGTSLPVNPLGFYRPSLGYDDSSLDYQIIQIAANIIDQADTDSYPTQIVFDATTFTGVENLPYIDMLASVVLPEAVVPNVTPPTGFAYAGNWSGPLKAVALVLPRLWNPHSGNPGDSAKTPVNFRLRAQTSSGAIDNYIRTRHQYNNDTDGTYDAPLVAFVPAAWNNIGGWQYNYTGLGGENYGPGASANPATNLNGSEIGFHLAAGWQNSFPNSLSDPHILSHMYNPPMNMGCGFSAISGTPGVTQFSTISPWIKEGFGTIPSDTSLVAPYDVVGFPIGRLWMGPRVSANPGGSPSLSLFNVIEMKGGLVKVVLECQTASGDWIPYSAAYFFPEDKANVTDRFTCISDPSPTTYADAELADVVTGLDMQDGVGFIRFDPRSSRWGGVGAVVRLLARSSVAQSLDIWKGKSSRGGDTTRQQKVPSMPPFGFEYLPLGTKCFDPAAASVWSAPANPVDSKYAGTADIASVSVNKDDSNYKYLDPDGIRRRGMAAYWTGSSFDGQPLANYNNPVTGKARPEVARNRPVILNRPFRSVAELGYVFRDTPWRNLDFFTVESGDSALLDFFCIHDTGDDSGRSLVPLTEEGAPVVAGKVSLNTRHPEVLAALIRGAARENQTTASLPISDADALAVGQGIVNFTTSSASEKGPFMSLADLVGRPVSSTNYVGFANEPSTLLTSAEDRAVKQRRETILRALVDSGSTRTWNVLIDVIAQSGRVSPDGNKFFPAGERRIWASTAIDRFTAKVIDRQWETVNE